MVRLVLAVPLALLLSQFLLVESAFAQEVQKQTSAALAQGSSITGSVVDQQSGLPIAHATITLFRGPTTLATTTTDNGGRFAFSAITPGAYFLGIVAPGLRVGTLGRSLHYGWRIITNDYHTCCAEHADAHDCFSKIARRR